VKKEGANLAYRYYPQLPQPPRVSFAEDFSQIFLGFPFSLKNVFSAATK
jgi:hypothetical protein